MKRRLLFTALAAVLTFSTGAVRAAEFTYHGNLQEAGKPADGKYDIELTLYSAQTGGSVIGGPLTMYAVPVSNGSFNTEADFGPLAKSFSQAYVGVKVRAAGKSEYAALDTRSSVTPDTNTSCPGSWSLDGNAGNPSGSYLGTTDSALVLKAQGAQIVKTDLTGGGTIPRWIGGGSQNGSSAGSQAGFIGNGGSNTSGTTRNQVGNFSVVVGGLQNSSGYTAANGFAFIGGGNANTANVDYGTIGGGNGNTVSANLGTVGGGATNFASGVGATVPGGQVNQAAGVDSFAAGNGAIAANANSFVWSDGSTFFSDGAVKEFDVQAAGGMAINGNPKNSGIELSIYPSSVNGGNYSNLFFGLSGQTAGILASAGGASSATSNDASFFFDDYNGTAATQTRMFSIAPTGVTVGGATAASGISMLPNGATAKIVLVAHGTQTSDMGFSISQVPTAGGAGTSFLNFGAAGDLQIYNATAEKPGGGSWTATSDRRIKQDISPIRDALDTVMKLRPVNFRYTPEYRAMEGGLVDRSYAGFIAQEYADVFPTDVVSTSKRVPGAARGDPTILALDPNPALITTVAAVQELAVENTALHKQIDNLEARLSKLEAGKGQ